jgi:hypothetical protein
VKIQIGLAGHSSGWEQLCVQEGIPYSVLDLSSQEISDECSILAVNRPLSLKEREVVERYLRNGGAVIGYTRHLLEVAGIEGTEQQLKYVVADHEDIFPDIYLLDLGVQGMIPRGANALRTDTGTFAVAACPLGGGFAVVLPFDVDAVFLDARPANKSFYFKLDRLPSERVSLVAKGELRQLVHSAFKYLHHVRGIPHVHLWYFPNDLQNVFAFRIDTDGASREEIDTLYSLGQGVAMSWFLDVKSHEQWLRHFTYFTGQEISLHCYEHRTYPTFEANLRNIRKGLQEMRRVGIQASGFTAPFGIWNPELARAIDEVGVEYSSEFSYSYDTLPLFAEANVRFRTLQVPIHPICIGSMSRVGYTDAQMHDYFSMIIKQKLSRNEPLFFYHHPSHQRWDVIDDLFRLVRQPGIENMTMSAYARWWKRRIGVKFTMNLAGGDVHIQHAEGDMPNDVWLHVVNPSGGEATLQISASIDLKSVRQWTFPEKPAPPPQDLRRIREFDPRQMVGELYNTLIRKL